MRVSPRQPDSFSRLSMLPLKLRRAASLIAAFMAVTVSTVHAQSQKPTDRVPPFPASITIDDEGVARDIREISSATTVSLPAVERLDLPQRVANEGTATKAASSIADQETLIAAARRRHQTRQPREIEAMVRRVAADLSFDAAFAVTIARIESNFDLFAVSDKGAVGVMQLMPSIVADQRLADPFDPEANIRAGVLHLKSLGQEFRHPVLVAAAYHAGAQAVRDARGIPQGPRTAEYVVAVLNGFYDLMAIAGPEAAKRDEPRRTASRPAAQNVAGQRIALRSARAEATTPSNPTGIWERGFVLHLD